MHGQLHILVAPDGQLEVICYHHSHVWKFNYLSWEQMFTIDKYGGFTTWDIHVRKA
jgi:hypothetical protein